MNTLYEDYINNLSTVGSLFSRMPTALFDEVWEGGDWAEGVADAINQTHERFNTAKEYVAGNELVVATGQQPGLFTGPLYTIYKAITAINLANRFKAAGVSCVPLFWVAGDDHDFEESRVAHFFTKRHELLSLSYAPQEDVSDRPMYRVPLDDQIHGFIDTVAAQCRSAEHTPEIQEFLHESVKKSTSLADWFARIMAHLFREVPLHVFLPWERAARIAALPVLVREIRCPLESTQLLMKQGRVLESMGYAPAIQRAENACNFFMEREGRRRNVCYEQNQFRIPETQEAYTAEALLDLLHDSPELFSPNVALRPIVQQQLFPVVAYVAGPGEVAYWAQLKPLFNFFDQPMPVVYPRARCVINTVKTGQLLRQYDLDSLAVMKNEDLLARTLRVAASNPAVEVIARCRPSLVELLEEMRQGISSSSRLPEVASAAGKFEREVLTGLEKLERRLLHADKEKRHTLEARIERLRTLIAPMNKPQERVLSVFSFLFEHGWPLIERMTGELELDTRELQEMEL